DVINTGRSDDIVLGGFDQDEIYASEGSNIVLGDNGYVIFETEASNFGDLQIALVEISTTSPTTGGSDMIRTGYGADLILGGGANDTITANVGETATQTDAINLVFGDFGAAYWNRDGDLATLDLVTSIDTAFGGRDVINTGRSDDIVLGGFDQDEIYASEGSNIVLGDSGLLKSGAIETNVPSFGLALRTLMSIADELGDDDMIATGTSTDLIFGGNGDDTIDAGQGDNIVLGDNGTAIFDSTVTNFGDLPIAILSVTTQSPAIGGNDMITTGLGKDIGFGGARDDTIVTDFAGDFSGTDGYDIVLGDHGYINFVNPETGTYTFLRDIVSIDPAFGGDDVISTGLSTDIIFGGNGNDAINAGIVDNFTDVVFGDNA
ncbi:calcium-binding protein, partial [Sulfitobacter sp.]|uniref:calcium-binding protein n=1 Tax=Sulfitobacter sp. TaxID=1903071 RepID=UPI00356871A1